MTDKMALRNESFYSRLINLFEKSLQLCDVSSGLSNAPRMGDMIRNTMYLIFVTHDKEFSMLENIVHVGAEQVDLCQVCKTEYDEELGIHRSYNTYNTSPQK